MSIAAGLALLTGVTACIGQGGLAMTPGTYPYVIGDTAPTSLGLGPNDVTIKVTVKCDSCA